MFCSECGEKLSLVFRNSEGLVPYCNACGKFRFPEYGCAVSMAVTNREKNSVLLARHSGDEHYTLFAGRIKKGESAEKTVTREFKEETRLNVVKYRYMSSRYVEDGNVLMFNYLVMAENGDVTLSGDEIEESAWFSFEDALVAVEPGSTAEYFLKKAVPELMKGAL